jgi:hypothetical protein
MGYTHYFAFKAPARGDAAAVEELYQSTLKEAQRIVSFYQKHATGLDRLSGYSAHTNRYGGLNFNGKQENAHESFVLREHYKQNLDGTWGGRFCKTAQKPYDVVVVAVLCLLKYRLGDLIDIGSDGRALDWAAGAALARAALKRKIQIPTTIKGANGAGVFK